MRASLSLPALALLLAVVGPASSPASKAAAKGKPEALTLVVMDPLALPLSCPCVKGYAQRDYGKLAAHLTKHLGQPVNVHFSESLTAALTRKTGGKADLIIGKSSVVRAGARANKMELAWIASLTGKDGKTTQTGLWVVADKDAALTVADLKGYRLIIGPGEADEKHTAALALLRDFSIAIPARPEMCNSCSDGALKVLDGHKAGSKVATVISSYAQPLLEGCGTIKKGDLRVIGETDPVPFVAAFVNSKLPASDRAAIQKALLAVGKDVELCKALETKKGFVAVPARTAKKK